MLDFETIGLVELERIQNGGVKYIITEKGVRVKNSIDKFLLKINPNGVPINTLIEEKVLKEGIGKTGQEIVDTSERIQNMKKGNIGKIL